MKVNDLYTQVIIMYDSNWLGIGNYCKYDNYYAVSIFVLPLLLMGVSVSTYVRSNLLTLTEITEIGTQTLLIFQYMKHQRFAFFWTKLSRIQGSGHIRWLMLVSFSRHEFEGKQKTLVFSLNVSIFLGN